MKIEFSATDAFQKDFKRLAKKFRTLEADLENAKRDVIEFFHVRGLSNQTVFPMQGFCSEQIQVCKIKKFACKALKGRGARSGIRIIYAFHRSHFKVDFIELYFKGEQINEDRGENKTLFEKI